MLIYSYRRGDIHNNCTFNRMDITILSNSEKEKTDPYWKLKWLWWNLWDPHRQRPNGAGDTAWRKIEWHWAKKLVKSNKKKTIRKLYFRRGLPAPSFQGPLLQSKHKVRREFKDSFQSQSHVPYAGPTSSPNVKQQGFTNQSEGDQATVSYRQIHSILYPLLMRSNGARSCKDLLVSLAFPHLKGASGCQVCTPGPSPRSNLCFCLLCSWDPWWLWKWMGPCWNLLSLMALLAQRVELVVTQGLFGEAPSHLTYREGLPMQGLETGCPLL